MTKASGELLEFVSRYDPAIQSLILGLRRLLLQEMEPCHEYVLAMPSKTVLLYGVTDRVLADAVCSIAPYRRHVNLMFYRGAELPDARRILEGDGKRMRHIRLTRLADLDRPEIRAYVRRARKHAITKAAPGRVLKESVTRVKRAGSTRGLFTAAPR